MYDWEKDVMKEEGLDECWAEDWPSLMCTRLRYMRVVVRGDCGIQIEQTRAGIERCLAYGSIQVYLVGSPLRFCDLGLGMG